jgi:hypothetical protein
MNGKYGRPFTGYSVDAALGLDRPQMVESPSSIQFEICVKSMQKNLREICVKSARNTL